MDPVQLADGSSLIRAHRVCFPMMIKLSDVQLKICTLPEMHMHFQYIKYWFDKGIRLIKSPDIFCDL